MIAVFPLGMAIQDLAVFTTLGVFVVLPSFLVSLYCSVLLFLAGRFVCLCVATVVRSVDVTTFPSCSWYCNVQLFQLCRVPGLSCLSGVVSAAIRLFMARGVLLWLYSGMAVLTLCGMAVWTLRSNSTFKQPSTLSSAVVPLTTRSSIARLGSSCRGGWTCVLVYILMVREWSLIYNPCAGVSFQVLK